MFKVTLDMGYGDTKAVSSDGKRVIFPSVVIQDDSVNFENNGDVFSIVEEKKPTDVEEMAKNLVIEITEDNEETHIYKVGQSALKEGKGASDLCYDKIDSNQNKACIAAACALLIPDNQEDIFLMSGLPISHFSSQQENFKKMLENYSCTVKIPKYNINKKIRFKRVELMRQGLAAIFNSIWDRLSEYTIPSTYIGVIDWGHKTVDYACFYINDNGQPEYLDALSASLNQGISVIQQNLNKIFVKKFQEINAEELNLAELKRLFNKGNIFYKGAFRQMKPELISLKESCAEDVSKILHDKWSTVLNGFNAIFLCGGGGIVMDEYINPLFKDVNCKFELVDEAQMGNALGYLKLAQLLDQQQGN